MTNIQADTAISFDDMLAAAKDAVAEELGLSKTKTTQKSVFLDRLGQRMFNLAHSASDGGFKTVPALAVLQEAIKVAQAAGVASWPECHPKGNPHRNYSNVECYSLIAAALGDVKRGDVKIKAAVTGAGQPGNPYLLAICTVPIKTRNRKTKQA